MFDDIAVIIPVRNGSSRIKNKVTLPFGDNNLLGWKINQIKQIINNNNIYVSASSDNLKHIASDCGVQIHHRDERLSIGHDVSFSEVITGIVKEIPFKYIAWVTVVVPLMSPYEYDKAFKLFIENLDNYDSLISVNILKEYLWDDNGPINYKADKTHIISQDLPNIYKITNGLYMRDKESILDDGYFIGNNPFKFVTNKISGIDIDEFDDYVMSKSLYPFYCDLVNNNNAPFWDD